MIIGYSRKGKKEFIILILAIFLFSSLKCSAQIDTIVYGRFSAVTDNLPIFYTKKIENEFYLIARTAIDTVLYKFTDSFAIKSKVQQQIQFSEFEILMDCVKKVYDMDCPSEEFCVWTTPIQYSMGNSNGILALVKLGKQEQKRLKKIMKDLPKFNFCRFIDSEKEPLTFCFEKPYAVYSLPFACQNKKVIILCEIEQGFFKYTIFVG